MMAASSARSEATGSACRPRRRRVGPRRILALLAGAVLALPGCTDDGHLLPEAERLLVELLPALMPLAVEVEDPVDAFETSVFPLVRENCAECHAGAGPGTPHVAHPDVATAYDIILSNQKVNLGAPDTSRLVQRLSADFHYCWSDCDDDAAAMEAAIERWARVELAGNDSATNTVESIRTDGRSLDDGIEDTSAERFQSGAIALYEFKENGGTVAHDTSGVAPALDLELMGDASFMSSYGIDFRGGRARGTRDASLKLYQRIAAPGAGSQQYTVEAWVAPANVTQEGPARIVSYSRNGGLRNFTLGQVLYNYNVRNRNLNPAVDDNGRPALQTADADQDLQATLQHVVVTYDQYRGRRVYVNGRFTDDLDEAPRSPLWNWDPEARFVLGDEVNGNREFLGQVRFVAVFPFLLTDEQITQNFNAGIGRRLLLRFDVSQWVAPGAEIEFVVSEYDDYSYLFCDPTVISPNATGFRVQSFRVAVNGVVPVTGQGFVNTDRLVTQPRQRLSSQCSIVPKDLGAGADVFSIEFERLADFREPFTPISPPPLPPPTFEDGLPDRGLRNFERIFETMGAVTGVDPNTPAVRATYDDLREALPPRADLRAFSSAQQIAIAKLSLEYCDALVDDTALRDAFFGPGVDFDAPATSVFADPVQRDAVIAALADRMLGTGVSSQPSALEVAPILDELFDELTLGCDPATCDAERTRTIVKAACSAVLSSGAVTVH